MNGTTKRFTAGLGAAVLTVALAATGLAQAGPGPGGPRGPAVRALRGALSAVDLTQDQKDKVRQIIQEQKPALQAFRAQAKANREALNAAVTAPNPDPAAVGAAFLKVHADREAMKAKRKALTDSISSVLTPDQKAKLDGYFTAVRHFRRAGGI